MKSRLEANPDRISGRRCTELVHHRSLAMLDVFQAYSQESGSVFLGHAAHKALKNLTLGGVKRADEALNHSLVIFRRHCRNP
jgi:hypothetical protein